MVGTEEEIETFCKQLDKILNEVPKMDIKMIIGDWNAKIGMDTDGWELVMWSYGYGERNERRERLLEFAYKSNMYIIIISIFVF